MIARDAIQGNPSRPTGPQPPRDRATQGTGTLVTVLTVDDHASFRRAMLSLVNATDGFEEVGSASTAEQAIRDADRFHPDLIVMDIRLPGMDGCEAARRIVSAHPDILVVLVSSAEDVARRTSPSACSAIAVLPKVKLRPALLQEIWEAYGRVTPAEIEG